MKNDLPIVPTPTWKIVSWLAKLVDLVITYSNITYLLSLFLFFVF